MAQLEIRGVPLETVLRLNAERTISLDRYQEEGVPDRFGYLKSLAEDHGCDFDVVLTPVDVLGPDEDFDGLVTSLEDGLGFL